MAAGIKHIEFADPSDVNWDNFLSFGNSTPNTNFIIRANKSIKFRAVYEDATPIEARNAAMWIKGPKTGRRYTINDRTDKIGDEGFLSIEPKFCGPQEFIIEAFIDHPTNRYPKQLTFRGYTLEKIVSTKWSLTKGGSDIRNSEIKYGDTVWLNVQTEGLNGAHVTVEVYDTDGFDEKKSTQHSICIDGEINLEFNDTFNWKDWSQIGKNEFYVKIKKRGGVYIKDDHDDEEHARFLTIENEVSNRRVGSSTTDRPLIIEQDQVNFERYELCKFEKITVKDQEQEVVLFDQDKLQLDITKKSQFQVSEAIHFDLDKSEIRSDAQTVLDGIARLLLDNPKVPVRLGAHCDIRADHAYNDRLSWARAEASVNYLVSKGIDETRIESHGYGKRRLLIEGEDLSEEEHQLNRRVTIEFLIFGNDAQSIYFDTIAGDKDHPVEVEFTIENYDTDPCIGRGLQSLKHSKRVNIDIITVDQNTPTSRGTKDGSSPFKSEVFADLSRATIHPFNYIWPANSPTNQFQYYIHSCRYYAFPNIATVVGKVYPDIKWDFHIFFNLSRNLSVKWQNLPPEIDSQMREEAGKIGAQYRWKRADVDFGVLLKTQWNKSGNNYSDEFLLTARFESKIRFLYNLFYQLKEVSKYITGETKGQVVSRMGNQTPFTIVMGPPNVCLGAEWFCSRGGEERNPSKEIGTEIKFYLKAEPIVKLELVIDLLALAVNAAVALTTGGTGNAVANRLYYQMREWLSGNENFEFEMYIELILSGEILGETQFTYHTAGPNSGEVTLDAKVGITFRAGINLRAAVGAYGVEFYALAEAGVRGEGFITFGHQLRYSGDSSDAKLAYLPRLLFDGIIVTVTVKAEVGMSIRRSWFNFDSSKKLADFHQEYNLVQPFDILEKIAGEEVSVNLID